MGLNPKFQQIRVRMAPSPTGSLHVGGARVALFNYLFAKKSDGKFILRIEDTDIERSDPQWEKDIIENLKWLGIKWDEGPIADAPASAYAQTHKQNQKNQKYIGEYGPYRQSERLNTYAKYLEKLLNEKKVYYCFCSEEELEAMRQEQMSRGMPPKYTGKCRLLSEKELKKRLAKGQSSIIRFKTPLKKIKFRDLIRDEIEFDSNLIGDFAVAKDLAAPLYNFAVVIDDFEMKISHIIRGEDHISNTPKQILIQEALEFPQPKYAHLPLILGPDRSKLSKRHEAVAIAEYRKMGYLPEALVNFMAFLGWNPGTEREIFAMPSLIKEFSLERCQKGGAIFNIKRLDFLNGFYIRQKSIEKLTGLCLPYLIEKGLIEPGFKTEQYPPAYGAAEIKQIYKFSETGKELTISQLQKIVSIYQERLKKLSEIIELTDFFFKDVVEYNKELLRWREIGDEEVTNSLDKLEQILSKIAPEEFNKENLEKILMLEADKFAKEIEKKMGLPAEALAKAGDRGYFLWPFRVALTGKEASAGPFEIAELLGKEKTLKRIKEANKKASL